MLNVDQALTLRAAGATYREIAAAMGCDVKDAYRLISTAVDGWQPENLTQVRELESDRLDRLQRAAWPQAMAGDTRAIAAVLRVMERRARLLGLDVPVQVTVQSDVDRQIEALAAELEGRILAAPDTEDAGAIRGSVHPA